MSDLTPKVGDVNGDGVVNMIDIAILAKNFGSVGATRAQGDVVGDPNNTGTVSALTPDGVIDNDDFTFVSANYAP